MVLDVVLGDLEARGHTQFLKTFEDHRRLVLDGVEYLESYYADKAEYEQLDMTDKHGVQWIG
jgi:hypothetical protein